MSTHVPVFQFLSGFLHHFLLAKLATSSIRVNTLTITFFLINIATKLHEKGLTLSKMNFIEYCEFVKVSTHPARKLFLNFIFHMFNNRYMMSLSNLTGKVIPHVCLLDRQLANSNKLVF